MKVKCFMDESGRFYRVEGETEEECKPKSPADMEKSVVSVEGLEALTFDSIDQMEWDKRVLKVIRDKQAKS